MNIFLLIQFWLTYGMTMPGTEVTTDADIFPVA